MSGERAALEAVGLGFEDEDEGEQFDLLGMPQTASLLLLRQKNDGPGRPKGSRNKRTERTVAFLLARHRDPREVLLEMAEARVDELAASLGCTAYQAYQEKRLAAIGVLPYVAQRQPLAIEMTGVQPIHIHIGQANGVRQSDTVAERLTQVIENPEFIDVTPEDQS